VDNLALPTAWLLAKAFHRMEQLGLVAGLFGGAADGRTPSILYPFPTPTPTSPPGSPTPSRRCGIWTVNPYYTPYPTLRRWRGFPATHYKRHTTPGADNAPAHLRRVARATYYCLQRTCRRPFAWYLQTPSLGWRTRYTGAWALGPGLACDRPARQETS